MAWFDGAAPGERRVEGGRREGEREVEGKGEKLNRRRERATENDIISQRIEEGETWGVGEKGEITWQQYDVASRLTRHTYLVKAIVLNFIRVLTTILTLGQFIDHLLICPF